MIRQSLCLCAMLATLSVAAAPETLGYLTFHTSDGSEVSIPSESLSITFSDGKMSATSADKAVTLPVNDLVYMYFSDQPSAITDIKADSVPAGPCTVYTTDGALLGNYSSLDEAASSLGKGIYIVTVDGKTLKLAF